MEWMATIMELDGGDDDDKDDDDDDVILRLLRDTTAMAQMTGL